MEKRVQDEVVACSEVRMSKAIALMSYENSRKLGESTLARKAAKYVLRCPYRKPTQVGGKRIARRTGKPLVKELGKMTP